ncbi:MAG: effector binding domain-containing protein, partial [Bacteroidota bacterium]
MEKEKPRLARLTAILTQLQSKKVVVARELAEKHQVSIRTIYRDIRTLEQSGIPIISEGGKGYSIMEGFHLPPVMFTEPEANALITAEKLLAQNGDLSLRTQYQAAITKIKAILKTSQRNRTELLANRLDIRPPSLLLQSDYLMRLQTAITKFQAVRLMYQSLHQQRTQRVVEPFALYSTQGKWILIAFCHLRKDFRSFRLDQIEQLTALDRYFAPHELNLEAYFQQKRQHFFRPPDIPLTPDPATFASNQTYQNMQTVSIPSFYVIGIATRTINEHQQAEQALAILWQRFFSEGVLEKIPNKTNQTVYALYTDYESDYTQAYTAILGCQVSTIESIPDGMEAKLIEGGTYRKFLSKGDLTQGAVGQTWQQIWQSDLLRKYSADFEVYGEKARNPKDAEVEIFV